MKRLTALLLLAASLAQPLLADVAKFNDKVAQAEAVPDKEAEAPPAKADDGDHPLALFILQALGYVWLLNLVATFGDYPYDDGGYVRWPDFANQPESGLALAAGRDQRFRLDAAGFELKGYGRGAWMALDTRLFRFFGPYAEVWTLNDGKALETSARLGAQIDLFQSDPFALALYGQWTGWFGSLRRQGGTFGLVARSLPFKPLTLEARLGAQYFDGFRIGEAEYSAGLALGRWEPYIGYRFWSLGSGGSESVVIGAYEGVNLGLRLHL
jgi:hypothetical protein